MPLHPDVASQPGDASQLGAGRAASQKPNEVIHMNRKAWALALGLVLSSPAALGAVTEDMIRELKDQIAVLNQRIAELEKAAATPSGTGTPAEPAATPKAAASWTEKVSLKGDLRYRYDNVDAEGAEERNRQRIRARLGLVAQPQDGLEVGLGLSTSSGGDPVSSNQTLGGGGSRKDVYVDLAYFHWTAAEGLNLMGGKFRNPLHRVGGHGLLWDGDWTPEGFGASWSGGPFFANLIGTWLESDSNATEEFSWGGQAGVTLPVTDRLRLTAGAGYYQFDTAGKGSFFGDDDDFFGNSNAGNLYLYDYRMVEAFAELGFGLAGLPASLLVDWVRNSDAGESDTGFSAGLTLGAAKKRGQWEAGYIYQDLEADAVLGLLTDSDFAGGGTDNKGHILRAGYALSDKVNLSLAWFLSEADAGGDGSDLDRLLLDLNFKY
jgi:hypothetical protein